MLCDECNQGEAIIHVTQIIGNTSAKFDLCQECGKRFGISSAASTTGRLTYKFPHSYGIIANIIRHDKRYSNEAYEFVLEAGRKIWEEQFERGDFTATHISPGQLLEHLRELAIEMFGDNAKKILNAFGVFRCEDFGEIVFNLAGTGLLTTRPEDTKEEFRRGYDFDEAFPETGQ